MPSWEQLRRGEAAVQRFRERVGPKVDVLWVLPDLYEEAPKPCMAAGAGPRRGDPQWRRAALPGGVDDPGIEFANVREHPLDWIWNESDAFARFRGTGWMQEPCRSCPLGRQEVDWGGCRCQALRLTGDAAATDPVCRLSPHHDRIVAAREVGADRRVRLSHHEAAGARLSSWTWPPIRQTIPDGARPVHPSRGGRSQRSYR